MHCLSLPTPSTTHCLKVYFTIPLPPPPSRTFSLKVHQNLLQKGATSEDPSCPCRFSEALPLRTKVVHANFSEALPPRTKVVHADFSEALPPRTEVVYTTLGLKVHFTLPLISPPTPPNGQGAPSHQNPLSPAVRGVPPGPGISGIRVA